MKNNNKLAVKLVVIALLIAMIFTFTHCGQQMAKEIGNGVETSLYEPTPAGPEPTDEGQIINQLQVTTGVKNHEQILHTMAAVTGIDAFQANVLQVYRQVEASLPTDNDIKVYTSAQQVAVTKLAAEFCFQLSTGNFNAQKETIWPGLNLNGTANTVFTAQNRAAFIDLTLNRFWGEIITDEERNMARAELEELMKPLIYDANGNFLGGTGQQAPVQRAFRAVCTATLSSAYVTLL